MNVVVPNIYLKRFCEFQPGVSQFMKAWLETLSACPKELIFTFLNCRQFLPTMESTSGVILSNFIKISTKILKYFRRKITKCMLACPVYVNLC